MKKRPRFLLIGAGRFGQVHLRVLQEMQADGLLELAGVVVQDSGKAAVLGQEIGIPVYSRLTSKLLKGIDAVDIVTPPDTHFALVKKCLRYTNVFVEKPLANTEAEALKLGALAKKFRRTLSVGHIFRYHPITERLKHLCAGKQMPEKITGSFINPLSSDRGWEPSLEFLHFFDLLDFLWEKAPRLVYARSEGRVSVVDMRYGTCNDARFILGWRGEERVRLLKFAYKDIFIEADFDRNIITTREGETEKILECPVTIEPLRKELLDFIEALEGGKGGTRVRTAARVIGIAESAVPRRTRRPSVAIIGGGIFGTSIAAELGTFCDVTLFERNSELMQEGTLINQFRHHRGYHYPRSDETVREIQETTREFENVFSDAIVTGWKTYYGLAKEGSLVSTKEFIAFCKRNSLPYTKASLQDNLLSKEMMDLVVEVDEPNYHHRKLKQITERRLRKLRSVSVLLNAAVTDCTHGKDGQKIVSFEHNGKRQRKEFDFVINATYARINDFARWLGYAFRPIRVDLAQVLILNLPIDPVSITVIDGPFATLMPTGNPHEFTLYHVKESILDRYVPENGLVRRPKRRSREKEIFRESLKLFPILKDATVVESRVVHRGVRAYHEHDDSRVTDLIDHGFGTWSVLSGKILSSVTMGRRIADIIRQSVTRK